MLSFEMVLKHDRLMKSLTGLSREEFEVLLPTFEQVWKESLESKERQRAVGGGLKGLLPEASHKLLYILFYMKAYPTFDVAGFVFGALRCLIPSHHDIIAEIGYERFKELLWDKFYTGAPARRRQFV